MPLSVDSTDGVSVVVHDLGGEGPVLLLAHGTGFCGGMFGPFSRHLADFHCFAPDLRGHGDTAAPESLVFRWCGFAADLDAVLEVLSPNRPVLCFAHSMGAGSSLLAEALHPGRFAPLYCFEPIVVPPGWPLNKETENRFGAATRRRRRSFESAQKAFENYAAKPPLNELGEASLRAYIEHGFRARADGSVHLKMDPENEALVYQMNFEHPTYERLSEVRCPVLVARGEQISHGPSAWTETIAERLANVETETFDDLGHMGPFEAPARIASSARRFFAKALD